MSAPTGTRTRAEAKGTAGATATVGGATTDPAELAGTLRVATNRLAHALRRPDQAQDLSPTRYTVLTTLAKRGQTRPGDLAAHMGVTRASMSRITDGLLDGGWVRRTDDPDDGRAFLLDLTEHGRDVLERVRREAASDLCADIAALGDAERNVLARALPVLIELADRQLARVAAR